MTILLPARTDVAYDPIGYCLEKMLSTFGEGQATYEGHIRQIASDVAWRQMTSFAFSSKPPPLWSLMGFFVPNHLIQLNTSLYTRL
jgi:hypothetical protein